MTGKFKNWNAWDKISHIKCPALVVASAYDEMDPKELEKMSQVIPHGKLLYCQGSHMSMWDDQQNYMEGVINFLKNTDAAK